MRENDGYRTLSFPRLPDRSQRFIVGSLARPSISRVWLAMKICLCLTALDFARIHLGGYLTNQTEQSNSTSPSHVAQVSGCGDVYAADRAIIAGALDVSTSPLIGA